MSGPTRWVGQTSRIFIIDTKECLNHPNKFSRAPYSLGHREHTQNYALRFGLCFQEIERDSFGNLEHTPDYSL
jgi:hypothetical protein